MFTALLEVVSRMSPDRETMEREGGTVSLIAGRHLYPATGAYFELQEDEPGQAYTIERVFVPTPLRGKGLSGHMIRSIADAADREGATLYAQVMPDGYARTGVAAEVYGKASDALRAAFMAAGFKAAEIDGEVYRNDLIREPHTMLTEKRDWTGYAPHDITHGNCYEWALDDIEEHGGVLRDVDLWQVRGHPDMPYHVWVERDGRAYDAESPEGVPDWWQLKYFQEHPYKSVVGLLKARDMPPVRHTL